MRRRKPKVYNTSNFQRYKLFFKIVFAKLCASVRAGGYASVGALVRVCVRACGRVCGRVCMRVHSITIGITESCHLVFWVFHVSDSNNSWMGLCEAEYFNTI